MHLDLFFISSAKLETKVEERGCGRCSIRSWQEFQAELKAQFMPGNVFWMGHGRPCSILSRCEMNVHQVVIDVDLKKRKTCEDKLFFMKGLKPNFGGRMSWTALAAADRLIDNKYVGRD